MSSIGSIASQSARLSPLDLLLNELSSEVSAGTVSASDEGALSDALEEIDATLSTQGASGTAPPPPSEMQAKIDDLIASEVENGKLTSEQADELKTVFSQAFAKGGPGGPGGPGGGSEPGQGDGTASSSSTDSDTQQLLQEFLKLLQDSYSSSSGYDASGQSTTTSAAALLLDYRG